MAGRENRLLDSIRGSGLDASRIVFSGYVGERTKLELLYFSQFCIYASLFEGFGIPVAEAAHLGKFVVCSNSASLPEVAPDRCFFFDPLDVSSFAPAMEAAQAASEVSLLHQASFTDVWDSVGERSWDRAYRMVRNWVQA